MRKLCLAASLTLSLLAPSWARPATPPTLVGKRISQDFVKADLAYVVKTLARMMGCNAFIGPQVNGEVTVDLRSVTPEAALREVLAMQNRTLAYKRPEQGILVVGPPGQLDQLDEEIIRCRVHSGRANDPVRAEFLLDKADGKLVIPVLMRQYRVVEFIQHPTMKGFYAVGPGGVLSQIKKELPRLDVYPQDPPALAEESVHIEFAQPQEIQEILATLVTGVTITASPDDPSTLSLKGLPWAVEQAEELLAQLDHPSDEIMFDCSVVSLSAEALKEMRVFWLPEQPKQLEASLHRPGDSTDDNLPVPNLPAQIGVLHGPCNGGPFTYLDFFASQGMATVVGCPRGSALAGEDCEIVLQDRFPLADKEPRSAELGLHVSLCGQLEEKDRIGCSITLDGEWPATNSTQFQRRHIETESTVNDGSAVVLRGLLRSEDGPVPESLPLLANLPIWGPFYQPGQAGRELLVMIRPMSMR